MVHCVYFSACGTVSSYVHAYVSGLPGQTDARFLNWAGREDRIPLELEHDDILVFAMPVYGGFIPSFCAALVPLLHGSSTPAAVLAVYGNRHYDDALVELQDLCEAQGFVVKGAAALVGRHTYGEIQVDRPDAADLEADVEFVRRAASGDGLHAAIPGNRPYQKQPMGKGQFAPLTSDACTGCGLCRKSCPAGAIRPDFQVDAEKCISCFRCIRICPAGAKNMDTEAYRSFAQMFTQKLAARRENEYFL